MSSTRLLALALLVAPWQSGWIAHAGLPHDDCGNHSHAVIDGTAYAPSASGKHEPGSHMTGDGCETGQACPSGHCPTCVPGIHGAAPGSAESDTSSIPDNRILTYCGARTVSIFRPPRA